mmetsp:Transcript_16830/g.16178  ORF Transcript_16830/g.16178 Transcript_16830/m.16178 type:complete len:92 (-) Transcript_16830:814-1089(-)
MVTYKPKIPRLAQASTDRVFYGTISIERTITGAIFGATVVTYERGGALGGSEPVTNTVTLSRIIFATWQFGDILHVHVLICMYVTRLAGMS